MLTLHTKKIEIWKTIIAEILSAESDQIDRNFKFVKNLRVG
jgi:hypothetical protein